MAFKIILRTIKLLCTQHMGLYKGNIINNLVILFTIIVLKYELRDEPITDI